MRDDRRPSPPSRRPFRAMLAAALLVAAAGRSAPAAADHRLTVLLVEDPGGVPAAARASIVGSDSLFHRPAPDSVCLFHTWIKGGYFYADSAFAVDLPAGSTRVGIRKGTAYLPFDAEIDIRSDTSLTVRLERWVDARDLGWLGGDTHLHLHHEPVDYTISREQAYLVCRAEGLGVANFLSNGYLFTGAVDSLSDEETVFRACEEYRSPVYGDLALLGVDSLLLPFSGEVGPPLNREVTERTRARSGALSLYAHPVASEEFFDLSGWPGVGLARGVWVDAPLGAVDGLEVFSYSNLADPEMAAFDLWYDLWNAGFPVPAAGGSDTGLGSVCAVPPGQFRVFAKVDDPRAAPAERYDAWIEALRGGRTFVSTGPVLEDFRVGGAGAGETLAVADGFPADLQVTGRFLFRKPLDGVEVIRNGEVVETIAAAAGTVDVSTTVPLRETSWIALRVNAYCYDPMHPLQRAIAHPTPVLVTLGEDGLTSAASGARGLGRLDLLETLLDTAATWPDPAESLAVFRAIDSARAVWTVRADAPPGPFHLLEPPRGCRTDDPAPLFRWSRAADPDSGEEPSYRLVLAADPGFADVRIDTSGLADTAWSPPAPLAEGEYWWRVRAEDPAGEKRWAEEIDRWLEVGTPTGVEEGAPGTALLFTVFPSPSRSGAAIRFSAPTARPGVLAIHDPAGRRIGEIPVPARSARIDWDGRDRRGRPVASGAYLMRYTAGDRVLVRKWIRIR